MKKSRKYTRPAPLKEINANARFICGEVVQWVSHSGNPYIGTIESMLEGTDSRGDLLRVKLFSGGYRSAYDNEHDIEVLETV